MTKAEVRQAVRTALRSAVFPSPEVVCARVCALPVFNEAVNILAYYPLKGEIDVTGLMDRALIEGRRVWLPVCMPQRKMEFRQVSGPQWRQSLLRAQDGTLCPAEGSAVFDPLNPEELTLVIVPGLAFRPDGSRLGRGGGYYDVFLKSISGKREISTLALCLSCQHDVDFPCEAHDCRVDRILVLR